jgi:peptide/nickel transport system ATP-binding protein
MSADKRLLNDKLLDVQNVTASFQIGGLFVGSRLVAVNNVSFALQNDKPEIYTLAGESGSGKTTLARLLLHDLDPTEGKVLFEGRDLSTIKSRPDHMEFMRKVQPVFQNPFDTFSPLRRVEEYLFDTAIHFGRARNHQDAVPVVDDALHQFPVGKFSAFLLRAP